MHEYLHQASAIDQSVSISEDKKKDPFMHQHAIRVDLRACPAEYKNNSLQREKCEYEAAKSRE